MINIRILLLVIIALIIRIIFVSDTNLGTGDSGANNLATSAYLQGKHVYELQGMSLSNPPFSLHVLSYWRLIGNLLGHSDFVYFWKVLASVFDALLVFLIYKTANLLFKSKEKAFNAALIYAFNPISITISSVHGQIESVWLFFVLLAFYLLMQKKQHVFVSALVFGIGVSIKMTPLILLPFIILLLKSWKQRIIYVGIAIFTFLTLSYPELYTSFTAVKRQVLLYQSTPFDWGFSKIIYQLFGSGNLGLQINGLLKYFMLGTIGLYWVRVVRKKSHNFLAFSLASLMLFFVFTPGFGTQYILWPLPFLILTGSPFLKRYIIFGSLIMFSSYDLGIRPISTVVEFMNMNFLYHFGLTVTYASYYLLWGLCIWFILKENILWKNSANRLIGIENASAAFRKRLPKI